MRTATRDRVEGMRVGEEIDTASSKVRSGARKFRKLSSIALSGVLFSHFRVPTKDSHIQSTHQGGPRPGAPEKRRSSWILAPIPVVLFSTMPKY